MEGEGQGREKEDERGNVLLRPDRPTGSVPSLRKLGRREAGPRPCSFAALEEGNARNAESQVMEPSPTQVFFYFGETDSGGRKQPSIQLGHGEEGEWSESGANVAASQIYVSLAWGAGAAAALDPAVLVDLEILAMGCFGALSSSGRERDPSLSNTCNTQFGHCRDM